MYQNKPLYPVLIAFIVCVLPLTSCKEKKERPINLVASYTELQERSSDIIRSFLDKADSAHTLHQSDIAKLLYEKNEYAMLWTENEKWKPIADSLYDYISHAQWYGLFPEDYHEKDLRNKPDKRDPRLWAKADIFLTDAFLQLIKDVKLGRLPNDSISLNKDSILSNEFYEQRFSDLQRSASLSKMIRSLEPDQQGYRDLKKGIRKFLDSADLKTYTKVPSPKDLLNFRRALQKRLYEGNYIAFDSVLADSSQLVDAVRKFQKEKGITIDGRPGEGTLRMLNLSDRERFIRIAISLDKYKKLPPQMPSRYIWVNTASNYMQVIDDGEVKISSKVICGKPKTRTPLLNSSISALITYPQWVPPPSIIQKEILPSVKKNPAYLEKKGFTLVDSKGEEVDPYSVDWTKYNKSMPYRVVQGSGDANALGVLKFHFDNKYSVYLHDTNQRYLFANAMRSLSHGCVRVQEWQELVFYIIRTDSVGGRNRNMADSVRNWLKKKEKHQIAISNKLPVFIRYFTCEGRNGSVLFYDDVYGEDQFLREKYFAGK